MQRIRVLLFICSFVIMMTVPGYAAATSSNAGSVIILPEGFGPADYEAGLVVPETFESFETESSEETETEESEEAETEEVNDSESVENDFDFSGLEDMILELLGGFEHDTDQETEIPVLEDQEDLPLLGEITPYFPALLMAETDQEHFVNCIRFDVSVSGRDYTLLFSPSYRDQLYIDSQDRLWNMGTSQIQGLVLDGEFNPYNTTGTLVYLAPCLGNNYTSNRNYGSPNWFREYYWTTSSGYDRLNYDDTYVQIQVLHSYFPFIVSDTFMYGVLFLVGGGVLLCWLNRYRRY